MAGGRGRGRGRAPPRARAPATRDDLGQDADRDLLRRDGAEVEPGRGLEPAQTIVRDRARAEGLDHDAGPRRARDQAHVVRLAPERLLERVLVEPAVGRHHDGGPGRQGDRRQVADHAGGREAHRRRRLGLHDGHREVRGGRQAGERLDHRPAADQDERGLRQHRLHEDLEGPAAVTGHRVLPHTVGAAKRRAALADQHQEPGLPVLDGTHRLLDHHRLRAAPADPARHGAIPSDDGLRPRLGRSGALAADHGRQGERHVALEELMRQGEQFCRSRHGSLVPSRRRTRTRPLRASTIIRRSSSSGR